MRTDDPVEIPLPAEGAVHELGGERRQAIVAAVGEAAFDRDVAPVHVAGFAQAAAMALLQKTELSAREITETALNIAGSICVFTNQNLTIEEEDCAE